MIMGIDPGVCGAAAILDETDVRAVRPFTKVTEAEMIDWLVDCRAYIKKAYIEDVHAIRGASAKSTSTFMDNRGWWRGVLMSFKIPFERVRPIVWQTALRCKSKSDKNVTKKRAQELFPKLNITHATADAILIAEYGVRMNPSVFLEN